MPEFLVGTVEVPRWVAGFVTLALALNVVKLVLAWTFGSN